MSHKIFDNDLVAIRKNKITLTLNKPAYIMVGKMKDETAGVAIENLLD